MVSSSFTTNPISLEELLKDAKTGKLQLPDFQRNWVWDEQRIIDLLASNILKKVFLSTPRFGVPKNQIH